MTGTVVGYDPGGNCKHGLAWAMVRHGRIVSVTTETLANVEECLRRSPRFNPWGSVSTPLPAGALVPVAGARRIAGFDADIPTCGIPS